MIVVSDKIYRELTSDGMIMIDQQMSADVCDYVYFNLSNDVWIVHILNLYEEIRSAVTNEISK